MKKIGNKIMKLLTIDTMKMIILFIPLLVVLIIDIKNNEIDFKSYLDVSIFLSFVFLFICNILTGKLKNILGRRLEDMNKLEENYTSLCKRYFHERAKMVYIDDIHNPHEKIYWPVIKTALRRCEEKFDIEIIHTNKDKKYEVPEQVKECSETLMNAHSYSKVYNRTKVRIDDMVVEGNKIKLTYSQTTFFDSLLTNRAMDYYLSNNRTVRDIYEPGPFISDLKESKLSNHLGFNGFIELDGDKVVFVMRNEDRSVGKKTLGTGVSAMLDTEYALDCNHTLTMDNICLAIKQKMKNELFIDVDQKELSGTIFAFYRDLVEGGKPQFLFHYKYNKSVEDFLDEFRKKLAEKRKKKQSTHMDGKELYIIPIKQLSKAEIMPDGMKIGEKKYKMTASTTASVKMFLEYLGY